MSTEVSPEVFAIAKRVLKQGSFSMREFYRACGRLLPGQFRHTVASLAVDEGATPEAVSAFLSHRSPETTRRFYATLAVPPKVPTLK